MIELRGLCHRYGDRTALRDLSFDVPRGSIFGLLGPNGSGKTTLFRILATLLTPGVGSATLAGLDVVTERNRVRRKIGVVFQSPSLDGQLTVFENVLYQGHLYGMSGRTLRRRTMELLARFGLTDRSRDRAATLSGGLKRRVELAKGLLHEPAVLLLDEPSTGLDPAARVGLMDYLDTLRREDGVTSLLTTHLMDEADRCDQVAVLDAGRLVALDAPAGLKATIGGDVVTIAAADPGALARDAEARFGARATVVDGLVRIERDRGHAFVPKLVEAFPGRVQSITVGKPTLEDVFVHLTGHRLGDGAADAGTAKLNAGEAIGVAPGSGTGTGASPETGADTASSPTRGREAARMTGAGAAASPSVGKGAQADG